MAAVAAGGVPELVVGDGVMIRIGDGEQCAGVDRNVLGKNLVGSTRNRRVVDRRHDVKALPGAPDLTVEGPNPQQVRTGAALKHGVGEISGVHCDVLVRALLDTIDGEV